FEPATNQEANHPGAFDRDDFNVLPRSPRFPATTLLAMLADQWQTQKLTGHGMPNTPFASDEGSRFAAHRQDTIHDNGLRGHFLFEFQSEVPTYTFGLYGGGEVVCGTIGISVEWTRGPDGYPAQDPDRENWGPDLAPGVYKSIDERRLTQPCIVLPPDPS